MKQPKEKTTILFVNKNPTPLKPIQVSSSLLLNWKKYVAGLLIIFFSLIATIGYLINHNRQQDILREKLSQKLHSISAVVAQIDTNAVKEKFSKIEFTFSFFSEKSYTSRKIRVKCALY